MKHLTTALFAFLLLSCTAQTPKQDIPENFHDFVVKSLYQEDFSFDQLKGKKVLIVNTASNCGLTPQYAQLEELYQSYKDQNFIVIGFPANNFFSQEPGNDQEIAKFCKANYGVTFPMMSKVSVKGNDQHPLYTFLTQKRYNRLKNNKVSWNFQKYLINEEGQLEKIISPKTLPTDKEIISWITK